MSPTPGTLCCHGWWQSFDYSKVKSKLPFKDNAAHTPGGGDRKIWRQNADYSHVKPRVEAAVRAQTPTNNGQVRPIIKDVTCRSSFRSNRRKPAGGSESGVYHSVPR